VLTVKSHDLLWCIVGRDNTTIYTVSRSITVDDFLPRQRHTAHASSTVAYRSWSTTMNSVSYRRSLRFRLSHAFLVSLKCATSTSRRIYMMSH